MSLATRVDRLERVLKLLILAGRRVRTEHEQKISIAIDAQIKDEEKLDTFVRTVRLELARLAESQGAIQDQLDDLDKLIKGRE